MIRVYAFLALSRGFGAFSWFYHHSLCLKPSTFLLTLQPEPWKGGDMGLQPPRQRAP